MLWLFKPDSANYVHLSVLLYVSTKQGNGQSVRGSSQCLKMQDCSLMASRHCYEVWGGAHSGNDSGSVLFANKLCPAIVQ